MRVWLHSQLCVLLSDKEKRQTNKSPATSTVTAGAGWCGEPITGTAGNSCHHTTNTLYLNLLLELLSCSGGSSVVRGPSEGHMRTEGGRSSPVPGYLGNTDTVQTGSQWFLIKPPAVMMSSRHTAHLRLKQKCCSVTFSKWTCVSAG